jgi:hypothetical protein
MSPLRGLDTKKHQTLQQLYLQLIIELNSDNLFITVGTSLKLVPTSENFINHKFYVQTT